ncbi:MAG TPA: hypothetical protein VMH37_08935 [Candidatus Binataceae bacterium]|nr:hypothetical protein [Candidatus Binataceae bacterium]
MRSRKHFWIAGFLTLTVALIGLLGAPIRSFGDGSNVNDSDPEVERALSAAADLEIYLNSHWVLERKAIAAVAVDVSGAEPVLNVQAEPSPHPGKKSWKDRVIESGVVPKRFKGFETEVTEVPVLHGY